MTIESPTYETTSTHNYTKPFTPMKKLTLSNVMLGFGIIVVALLVLSFTLGLVSRGIVELFKVGYSFFGLW
jgi:hypothetical protein